MKLLLKNTKLDLLLEQVLNQLLWEQMIHHPLIEIQ